MSRTDKDRPYCDRINDRKEATYDYHDHLLFGKEINYVRNGKHKSYVFADECTINENEQARHVPDVVAHPCGRVLGFAPYYGRHSPGKKARKVYYWGPMRAARTKYLTEAVKDYNAFGEVDEDFFFQEQARYGRFGGGYWD
jgi:hypothetical protein